MALEDLTGTTKYINAFNSNNPGSLDQKKTWDDHIRGIKNVLVNTFPNIAGAVTLTQSQINGISPIPSGTTMIFYQASAPTDWTQDTTYTDYALRVTSGTGGGVGGSDAPFDGITAAGAHTLTEAELPAHAHSQTIRASYQTTATGSSTANVQRRASDAFQTTVAGSGDSHSHNITYSNLLYSDVIMATRD